MHELGICDALLKMVRNIAAEESLEEITRITVEVGSLSGVVPAYMSEPMAAANPARVTRFTFPDAGHGMSYLMDTPRYQRITRDFIESCLK